MQDMDNGGPRELRDPQESDPKWHAVIKTAEQEADKALRAEGINLHLGYCHRLWSRQKQSLKEKYDIDWKTPAEMNPHILFD